MHVTRDVVNESGVLLVEGTILNEAILSRLQTWGIDSVEVSDEPGEAVGSGPNSFAPEVLREAEETVNRRFRHLNLATPLVTFLRDRAVRRTALTIEKALVASEEAKA